MSRYSLSLIIIFAFLSSTQSFSQVNWQVDKSISLNPNRINEKGTLTIYKGKQGGTQIVVNGDITLLFEEKKILFNDGSNTHLLKIDQIGEINFETYGIYDPIDFFKKSFRDSIYNKYRRSIYKNLDLNEISFSLSKRIEYELTETGLSLKNQKILKGKILFVDLNSIAILGEDGEINILEDGDFNFINFGQSKIFNCSSFYKYLFDKFDDKLLDNINQWEDKIKKGTIESVVAMFGQLDKVIQLTSDKRIMTWKKSNLAYYVNMGTTTRNISSSSLSYTGQGNERTSFNLYGISPLFLSGNVYRNSNLSILGSQLNTSVSVTSQNGVVTSRDEGLLLTIVVDANNKILEVYHENIFSSPQWGQPFRFISF